MAEEYALALDIGTTSTKAVLFSLQGEVLAESERELFFISAEEGFMEQDPDAIEQLSVQAIADVMKRAKINKDALLSLGISCAMHSLICLDEDSQPLSHAITWADARSKQEAEALAATTTYEKTGVPNHPMSPVAKLMWMKEQGDEAFLQAASFVSVKEYILLKWFGLGLIDYSMAAATGLMDGKTYEWDEEILAMIGIKAGQLSTIVPPTTLLPKIKSTVAEEMGISETLPVVIGAADGALANLGSGAVLPGEVAISAGTSGAIRQIVDQFQVDEKRATFCYAFTPSMYLKGGATNNGGITLQWLKEILQFDGEIEDLLEEATDVPAGAGGLFFHPYVNGERAPFWQASARGNFFGLRIHHQRKHLVKAVLEGITYNLYHIGQALEEQAGKPKRIYVNGGMARSASWVQLVADVFGVEVYVSESHHSAAWGAAWLGLLGVGKVQGMEEIKEHLRLKEVVKPNASNHAFYRKQFQTYYKLSEDIAKYF